MKSYVVIEFIGRLEDGNNYSFYHRLESGGFVCFGRDDYCELLDEAAMTAVFVDPRFHPVYNMHQRFTFHMEKNRVIKTIMPRCIK